MFNVSDRVARILELFENSRDISEIARELGIAEKHIRGVLRLLDNKIKRLSPKPTHSKPDIASQLVLFVTQGCNFKCRYCCSRGLYPKHSSMRLETGKKAIAAFLKLYPNNVKTIVFLGGEPLLCYEVVKHLVKFTLRLCRSSRVDIVPRFGIVTNGALLTSDVVKFLKRYGIMTTVSLDGPLAVNDFQRILPSGEGTHSIVMSRIKTLTRARHSFNIEATVTRRTIECAISVREILLYLHTLGAEISHIMPVCGEDEETALPWRCRQSIADGFKDAASYTMESLLTQDPVWLQYVRYILESLIRKIPRKYLCFAGLGTLTVFPNGDVYPCYFLVHDSLLMGNIHDSNFPNERFFRVRKLLLERAKDSITPCKACWARSLCHSCYGFGFSLSETLSAPPEMFCLIQKAMIEAVLLKLAEFRVDSRLWHRAISTLRAELSRAA